MKKLIPQKIKNIYHLLQAVLANIRFGFPSRKLKVIGVTGTNGKTTTVQMVTKILEEAGFGVAMASTINFKLGEEEWVNKTKFTTLSPWKVQGFIKKAIDKKCDYLVLETSSHSLDQYRVWGVDYDLAVITNVTREHLDYHKTMKIYREAKLRLFRKARKLVVNLDMEKPEEYLSCKAETKLGFTASISNLKFQISSQFLNSEDEIKKIIAKNIELGISGSKFTVEGEMFVLNLAGSFNVENALAAISVGVSEGIDLKTCARAIEKIEGVSGRMEYVKNDKGLNIIVDYAVTPDSLEKLYALIKEVNVKNNKIIAVFGSCGERDRGKRPIMGEIVARKADFVIVTNEDPYNEDPVRIINEVFEGVIDTDFFDEIPKLQITNYKPCLPAGRLQMNLENKNNIKAEGENVWRILDRREAIKFALDIAQEGDFVIVTGKGAEETMAVGDKRIPWNDKAVILEELKKL